MKDNFIEAIHSCESFSQAIDFNQRQISKIEEEPFLKTKLVCLAHRCFGVGKDQGTKPARINAIKGVISLNKRELWYIMLTDICGPLVDRPQVKAEAQKLVTFHDAYHQDKRTKKEIPLDCSLYSQNDKNLLNIYAAFGTNVLKELRGVFSGSPQNYNKAGNCIFLWSSNVSREQLLMRPEGLNPLKKALNLEIK